MYFQRTKLWRIGAILIMVLALGGVLAARPALATGGIREVSFSESGNQRHLL